MKTKLYKMWIEFCKNNYPSYCQANPNNGDAYLSFRYNDNGIKMHVPSPAYDAWLSFHAAKSADAICDFIITNFEVFKDYFPVSCIFLDLHQLDVSVMLNHNNVSLINSFRNCLRADVESWE